ncbi:phosphoglycolate phosphatase [Rhodobacteraceae bacterium N5(2021)]|uniref:Phosphoglycolate phosphatase n=1 Tax=Gymnodinialimonas phycosphaerae TaxID=2841589 RepID=A0A975YGJ3_9RHOB|nr:phosphoglycolate phosphatase [Gymnodinialimonas phycosphaerae]MBY4891776.1 phosphoglycolate phosphatase [Gymnodinialimonas phycosphaerae]
MARIVFDLDGTLIDSVADIAAAANATLAEVGEAPLSVDQARSFVGAGAVVFVERMARARDLPDPAPLVPRFLHHYEGAVTQTLIYPGVEAALARLEQRGHSLGLCTNKPHLPTQAVLAHLGWADLFDTVLTGDSLPQRKPDPAPLLAAFDALGTGPSIYVGDSDVDAETAARAHVPFVLFTPGYRTTPVEDLPHTAAFDDWSEIPNVIVSLGV